MTGAVRAAAGLVGLGLAGGTATIIHNATTGDTVKIKDAGKTYTVHVKTGGKAYSCPADVGRELDKHEIMGARIKLTLQRVRREEDRLLKRYKKTGAPHKTVIHYNALAARDRRLVAAYNVEVDTHNSLLHRRCTQTSGGKG